MHRERDDDGGPALPCLNGYKMWYTNGELHRDGDLPAVKYTNGHKEWYRNGVRHRDDNLPAVEHGHGGKEWWKDGKKHRDRGPAVVYSNAQATSTDEEQDYDGSEEKEMENEWWFEGNRMPANFFVKRARR